MSHIALQMPRVPVTAERRLARARAERGRQHRVDRRARLATGIAMTLLASAVIGSAALPGLAAVPSAVATDTISVRVGPGETLWEIADRAVPNGASTAQFVDHLMTINALEDPSVPVGTILEVPVSAESRVVSR